MAWYVRAVKERRGRIGALRMCLVVSGAFGRGEAVKAW